MLGLPAQLEIYACTEPVDFRKQHDGLVAIVREALGRDPLDGSLFVFFNRRRDRIKLLVFDRNGFWLMYKRLEQGTYEGLRAGESSQLRMSRAELSMLLDGFDLKISQKRKHYRYSLRIESRASERSQHGPSR